MQIRKYYPRGAREHLWSVVSVDGHGNLPETKETIELVFGVRGFEFVCVLRWIWVGVESFIHSSLFEKY